jgi:RNA polymerase-binding transcription factor DksA
MATDTPRSRVADVMAVLPSGQRIAFEVQYADLSVHQWAVRHESYRAQGIVDVWLWGHTRIGSAHHRPDGRDGFDGTRFALTDVQAQVRSAGLPVLFLNPEREDLAVAVNEWENDWTFVFEREAQLSVNQLGDYTVDGCGLVSDMMLRLHATEARRQAHLDAEEIERRSQLQHLRSLLGSRLTALEVEKQMQAEARERARAQARDRHAQAEARLPADNARRTAEPIELQLTTIREGGYVWTHCLKCGLPLNPVYRNVGYHILCNPKVARNTSRSTRW